MAFTSEGSKEHEDGDCPSCGAANHQPGQAHAPQGPIPVSALVLTSVGGMVLFLGSFFGLVAVLGISGFLLPALVISAIGALMMIAGWRTWRKDQHHHSALIEKEKDRLLCDYCGGQNAEGELQCRFCGAPLR